jgi:ELWxxDGT repeat protein
MRCAMTTGLAALLLALPAAAETVSLALVKDIDTSGEVVSSAPQRFRAISGKVYFAAKTAAAGQELFVSDGSAAPPRLVADIAPGGGSSTPTALGMAGGRLILSADDGVHGQQFWSVDAAGAATRLLSDSTPASSRPPLALGTAGSRLVFQGGDRRLWSSDGSPAGTQRLGTLYANEQGWPACSAGGRVLLLVQQGLDTLILATDGTPAGTVTLASEIDVEDAYVAGDGSHCYFGFNSSPHWKIWRSDGTTAGTSLWRQSASSSWLCGLGMRGSQVYALEHHNGFRLIDAATQAAQLSLPQDGCGRPAGLYSAAGKLAFFAPQPSADANWNQALYLSDGTAAGTQPVPRPADLFSWQDTYIAAIGSRLVYIAHFSGPHSVDPLTGASTPLPEAVAGLVRGDMAALGGAVLLPGHDAAHGDEVWRSDGTPGGTALLHDVWMANASGLNLNMGSGTAVGDTFFFVRPASQHNELWRSDGSAAGTTAMARDLHANRNLYDLMPLGSDLLFSVLPPGGPGMGVYRADAALGTASLVWSDNTYPSLLQPIPGNGALYDCDGTGPGNLCALPPGLTQPVIVAQALQVSSQVQPLGSLGNSTFFLSTDAATAGLWRSDGTAPGTYRVAPDLYPPQSGGVPQRPAAVTHAGRLWFYACDDSGLVCGLHVSDGSGSGTRAIASLPVVRDIQPLGSEVAILTGRSDTQLWRSDGTKPGTRVVAAFGSGGPGMASTPGRVHFIAEEAGVANYYVSDGSAAGTHAVALPPQTVAVASAPVALGADSLLFRCTAPATGEELCVTNAQADQASLLRDVYAGSPSAAPRFLGRAGATAYFSIDDGSHGRELWRARALGDAIFASGFQAEAAPVATTVQE